MPSDDLPSNEGEGALHYYQEEELYYAISDLHGCYDKYKRMLKIIRFRPNDTLYILGDVVDRGDGGIRILQNMTRHKNIIPLWGNHDYMAYYLLKALYDLGTDRCAELLEEDNADLSKGVGEWGAVTVVRGEGGLCQIFPDYE